MCSGETATSSCSRVGRALEWSIDMKRVVVFNNRSVESMMILMVDGINFSVTLTFQNVTLITSNISFTATPAEDGRKLGCVGETAASFETIHVVTHSK